MGLGALGNATLDQIERKGTGFKISSFSAEPPTITRVDTTQEMGE
jgi:hypothetical protein